MEKTVTITKIEKQRKNEKRYSIFIDEQFAFGMSDVDVLFYKLKEDLELSQERYQYILDNVIFTKARDSIIRFLGYSPRTAKEVLNKLKTLEIPEEISDRVMELMQKYGYVDDYKYAENYIKDKTRLKGYGSIKIKYELTLKGIDKNIVTEILGDYDFDEEEMAYNQLEKKARGNTDLDDKEKRRLFDFLLRKGFSSSIASKALKKYVSQG